MSRPGRAGHDEDLQGETPVATRHISHVKVLKPQHVAIRPSAQHPCCRSARCHFLSVHFKTAHFPMLISKKCTAIDILIQPPLLIEIFLNTLLSHQKSWWGSISFLFKTLAAYFSQEVVYSVNKKVVWVRACCLMLLRAGLM
jgi:hypothetical protein